MRQGFAHEALLSMDPGTDTGAPGAAVTVELCGHWQHEPPCPLSPHHTRVERCEGMVRLRVLFAVEAQQESEVRQRINRGLSAGQVAEPDETSPRWQLVSSMPSAVLPSEREHVQRLIQS
ncbi:MAG: hypothetical protein ACR2JG_02685 [Geodermatophilaceae bacterium]